MHGVMAQAALLQRGCLPQKAAFRQSGTRSRVADWVCRAEKQEVLCLYIPLDMEDIWSLLSLSKYNNPFESA